MTHNILRVDGWTDDELKAMRGMIGGSGWTAFQKWLHTYQSQLGMACLVPSCTPEAHQTIKAENILLEVLMKQWASHVCEIYSRRFPKEEK